MRTVVPVTVTEGFPFVPASIGGTPVTMLLDTGSDGMLVTPEVAAALQLPPDPGRSTRLLGTGGSRDAPNVMLRGLRIGTAALSTLSVPVLALPLVPRTEPALAGLLGAPLLADYDLDLDVPRGRMTLLTGCGAPGPDMTPLPLTVQDGQVLAPVWVNGVALLALLDTGSRATILTAPAAARAGLGRSPSSANTARGVDGAPLAIGHARARSLQLGERTMTDVPVSIAPLALGRADMVLGLDQLGQRRVVISYRTRRAWIGPIAEPPSAD